MKTRFPYLLVTGLLLSACAVGPDYVKPNVIIPAAFKEAPSGWKTAAPQDDCDRGPWWELFNDPELSQLEAQVMVSNQNVAVAYAQFQQAIATISQARAGFYPTVSGLVSITREKFSTAGTSQNSALNSITTGTTTTGTTTGTISPSSVASAKNPFTDYDIELSAAWAPDIWGSVRRNVESKVAGAQASAAEVAAMLLLSQTTLAQYYFQLRGLDGDQKVLDDTVNNYQKLLKITTYQYEAGTASRANILQAQSLLEQAQVQAIDNGINRAVYEHAIAMLIGKPPALFAIIPKVEPVAPPAIPCEFPSTLLERRPDIAQAERSVAQANAEIGVQIAAFYPVLTLTGTEGFNSTSFSKWFTSPANYWSYGAQLADVLFDGGLRSANVAIARGMHNQTVAQYRQTVLAAFQNVEDNLATLRILDIEVAKQNEALITAQKALQLVLNEFQAGTAQFSDVLNAELTLFTAQKGANDIAYRRMVAAVGLISALGGGWDAVVLNRVD